MAVLTERQHDGNRQLHREKSITEAVVSRFNPPTRTVYFSLTQKVTMTNKRYQLYYRVFGHSSRVTRHAYKRAGFKRRDGVAGWNGMWGRHLTPTQLKKLNPFQKVNHFPHSFELGRKDRLCRNMQRMQRVFGKHYDFFPKSFILPRDYREFEKEAEENEGPWILKPCASCRGIGIRLVKELDDVNKNRPSIISRYIANPFLINELKFDLRIYVAVTSYDPLRIYLYDEGLTRFSTHKYKKGSKHITNRYMHLTNFSVNKHSKKFVSNTDSEQDNIGHKWSLGALRRWCAEQGIDDTPIFNQIKDIVIKTLISVESNVVSAVKMLVPHRNNCYELFGFDVLVDDKLKCWLLEVNVSPSLNSEAPIDVRIKGQLMNDLFNLIGFVAYDRKKLKEQMEQEKQQRLLGLAHKKPAVSWEEKVKRQSAMCGQQDLLAHCTDEDVDIIRETMEEDARRGHFERIFPTADTESYLQFFEFSRYHNVLLHEWFKAVRRSPVQWPPAGFVYNVRPPGGVDASSQEDEDSGESDADESTEELDAGEEDGDRDEADCVKKEIPRFKPTLSSRNSTPRPESSRPESSVSRRAMSAPRAVGVRPSSRPQQRVAKTPKPPAAASARIESLSQPRLYTAPSFAKSGPGRASSQPTQAAPVPPLLISSNTRQSSQRPASVPFTAGVGPVLASAPIPLLAPSAVDPRQLFLGARLVPMVASAPRPPSASRPRPVSAGRAYSQRSVQSAQGTPMISARRPAVPVLAAVHRG